MNPLALILRTRRSVVLLTLACGLLAQTASAEDLFLADGRTFPGQLWLSEGGTTERSIHRRQPEANPAFPSAVMQLGQVAVGPDGKVYFASGLDGSMMQLLDGRHEIQVFEFNGQIRDVACTDEEHTVYFSVVPTPVDGQTLADGKIYRRDLWNGQPSEVATVRQSEVGGNWWGAFTIKEGLVYIATFEERSRLFKLTTNGPESIFSGNTSTIRGIASGPDGSFYFTAGTDTIYRTTDFERLEIALRGNRPFTDVALRATADATAP